MALDVVHPNQVAVLERAGPARALARSWRLVRHSFWRVFGITLLAQLIVGIASVILQVPFSIPAALVTSHAGNPLHPPTLAVIIGTVGTVVLAVAVVLRRIGPVARSRHAGTGLLGGDPGLTARGHRNRAERCAAAGDYAAAILE